MKIVLYENYIVYNSTYLCIEFCITLTIDIVDITKSQHCWVWNDSFDLIDLTQHVFIGHYYWMW